MTQGRFGAILWLLCLQYFVAEAVSAWAWGGTYSYATNYISDLGAVFCDARVGVCSPWHALMNASFVLQAILILGGALLVRPLFPRGGLWLAGLALVGASGFGVLAVGLAPEDSAPGPHYLGALENFLFCNFGMALLGVALLRAGAATRIVGVVSVAAGLVGLTGLALLGAKAYFGFGVGVVERCTAYPFTFWLAGMGEWLLGGGGRRLGGVGAQG